jgi:hypothetical protein
MRRRLSRIFYSDRAITQVVAWSLVGAVISLVVAAAHALLDPVRPVVGTQGPTAGASRFAFRDESSLLVDWYVMLGGQRPISVEDYGFPFRSWSVWHQMSSAGRWRLVAGVSLSRLGKRPGAISAMSPEWALPAVPRPVYLAGNAVIYGLVAWSGSWAFRTWSGRRRARRGLCWACGYGPAEGASQCPECGRAWPART